jgi:serine/threonine protein phosphatase PrpC
LYKRFDFASVIADLSIKHRKDVTRAVQRLTDKAIEHGEQDNISVALIVPKSEG